MDITACFGVPTMDLKIQMVQMEKLLAPDLNIGVFQQVGKLA
jgi:hypothetical protein